MSLDTAIAQAAPGDVYWMLEGVYDIGSRALANDATPEAPIVFRASPGERVQIIGHLGITGAYTWVWGLEIADPTTKYNGVPFVGIQLAATGAHAINNVIHDLASNGISAFTVGPDEVVYGNIVYRSAFGELENHPHNIYTQNDYDKHGHKYFVGNALLDSDGGCAVGVCFNFHAYTEGGLIDGMYLTHNVVAWGRPSVYRNNQVMLPPDGVHVSFRTSAYTAEGREEGVPQIQATDTWNDNVYSAPFSARFHAGGNKLENLSLEQWRLASAAAGNPFDAGGQEVPPPTDAKVAVIRNEYERGRGLVVIYNWGLEDTVDVNLASVVSELAPFTLHDAMNAFDAPLVEGIHRGPVSVPTQGAEFLVLLLRSGKGPCD